MSDFNVNDFYKSYPGKVILRPGYPARAQYKSTLMWGLFGKTLIENAGKIEYYADVGGCFGFGANAMAFHITQNQGFPPNTKVFEIAEDFISLGQRVFPNIEFINQKLSNLDDQSQIFDLVTMFDVIEHIENPSEFLKKISTQTRFFLLKTPMETGGICHKNEPLANRGDNHPDGHVNFFTPRSYVAMLTECGLEIIGSKLVRTIVKPGLTRVLNPEELGIPRVKSRSLKTFFGSIARNIIDTDIIPYGYFRFYWGGGDHLCLVRSKQCS